MLRPLEEYRGNSATVAMQHVEEGNKDADLGADVEDDENEGGSDDEEDEEEEVGTYQHDGRTFEEALMDEISDVNGSAQSHRAVILASQADKSAPRSELLRPARAMPHVV